MSQISEQKLRERIATLTNSSDSIQMISQWILHHYRVNNIELITEVWLKEISREPANAKMVNLLYLANDVIQNGKKKGPELSKKFFVAIESSCRCIRKKPHDESVLSCLKRLFYVWEERGIYTQNQITRLEIAIGIRKKHVHGSIPEEDLSRGVPKLEFSAEKVEHLESSAKEMIQVLRKLENAPSCDENTRNKLASYPEALGNTSLLQQVKCEAEAKEMLAQNQEAGAICKKYCESLGTEVLDRRNLQNHLSELADTVKLIASRNAQVIEELAKKEDHLRSGIREVQKAFDSLPDLNEMERDAGPLPSLGELFAE